MTDEKDCEDCDLWGATVCDHPEPVEVKTLMNLLNDRKLEEAHDLIEDCNEVSGLLKPGDIDITGEIKGFDLIGLALMLSNAYATRCQQLGHQPKSSNLHEYNCCEDCDADRFYIYHVVCRFMFSQYVPGINDISRLGRSIYGLGGQHP